MPLIYRIPPEKLGKFKEPFGQLIRGSPSETTKQLQSILEKQKPPLLISVGDAVSRNLHKYKIIPHLSITDNKSLRKELSPKIFPNKSLIRVSNPEGTITQEAIQAVQAALKDAEPTQILVEGEEDLLTLIVVLYAPENSAVVYGQPNEGVVFVVVTQQKKAEAKEIWESMQKTQTK